ncbi:DUF4097 family beta strand repeat-containing protein [Spirillospora albida]|uniref:DUF4097 family beta strand repeat-containing protein n=1 Tax=Spirillospora albida TaxID=58123 RepID=UPI0004C13949|nr:DUF4097 family beta strand repeat-containing protein [Spirillospora albida]
MPRWTIDEPTALDFDGVVALRATLITGSISVLASDERPSVMVSLVEGPPLIVAHEAGILTITHEKRWEGLLTWLRTQKCRADITVTVPPDCPVGLNLVTAEAVITGLTAPAHIKSVSGDVTLDGVTGTIDANTASGAIEAREVDGTVSFTSVAGDLSLAGGAVDRLSAQTVSGRVAADVDLIGVGDVHVHTVSGEVTLRIPESADAEVTLSSAGGRVTSSFPGLSRADRTGFQTVSGKIGDGSGRLSVNSVAGSIALMGRPDDPDAEMEK